MKLRNLFELAGFRGKPRRFPYQVHQTELADKTAVRYAQWLHPRETKKPITSEAVDGLRRYLDEGDFCIDIGAHTGDSTLPMALAVGRQGTVLALEPNPYVYHVLEKNARANAHLTNIKTMMAAAAGDEGFLEFEYSDSGFCNGGRHEGVSALTHGHAFKLPVFCVNLEKELREDFSDLLPRLTFVKIDAEGYDLFVLRSIIGVVKEFRPVVKAEVFKNTDAKSRSALLSLLQEIDYAVYRIVDEPVETGPRITEENVGDWKHYDILCIPHERARAAA